jgi:hypothetical protein
VALFQLHGYGSAQSLWQAAEWFVKNYESLVREIPTVATAIELFLKTRKGKSVRTINSHRGYLNEFSAIFGKQAVNNVTASAIEKYLDDVKVGEVAKLHRWDTLHAFFSFCSGKKNPAEAWIARNPVKQVTEPEYDPGEIEIYTAKECRKLIQASLDLGYAANVVLRLFSMIRESEVEKMVLNRPENTWSYIHLKAGHIALTAKEVKTRADKARGGRRVAILPILERWIRTFLERGWTITHSRSVYEKVRKKINSDKTDSKGVKLKKLGRGSGYTNLIRHTSISNRLAIEKSIYDVSRQAGTSEPVITRCYDGSANSEDAAEFFSLEPEQFKWPLQQPKSITRKRKKGRSRKPPRFRQA